MKIVGIVAFFFLLTACATKYPQLVSSEQPQDKQLSCSQLHNEISTNEANIARLAKQQDKTLKNFLPGTTGLFFAIPWFLIDFSEEEAIEILSYEMRNQQLHDLALNKKCF